MMDAGVDGVGGRSEVVDVAVLGRASCEPVLTLPFFVENVRDRGVDPLPELVVRVHELHADAGERARCSASCFVTDARSSRAPGRDRRRREAPSPPAPPSSAEGILGVHEHAAGADVRGVLEHEICTVAKRTANRTL